MIAAFVPILLTSFLTQELKSHPPQPVRPQAVRMTTREALTCLSLVEQIGTQFNEVEILLVSRNKAGASFVVNAGKTSPGKHQLGRVLTVQFGRDGKSVNARFENPLQEVPLDNAPRPEKTDFPETRYPKRKLGEGPQDFVKAMKSVIYGPMTGWSALEVIKLWASVDPYDRQHYLVGLDSGTLQNGVPMYYFGSPMFGVDSDFSVLWMSPGR